MLGTRLTSMTSHGKGLEERQETTQRRKAARGGGARAAWPAASLFFARAVGWRNASTPSSARSLDRARRMENPPRGFLH